jgi:glycerophosphoryl diester phosphodiesterase
MNLLKLLFIFFSSSFTFSVPSQKSKIQLPTSKNTFIVIAHRGSHAHVPENTIASVREAIEAGADYVEIDLRTTKDGYLVLQHDASVNRMTNSRGNVRDLLLDSIKNLEITSKESKVIFRVPEFKEVLEACKNHINIYLDFKDADVTETYRQIREAGMEKQIVVYLNKEEQYEQWRRAAPAMPLMTSLPENVKNENEFNEFIKSRPIEVLDNVYNAAMIAVTNNKGIAIWIDVEGENENPAIWKEAISKEIQGMQTDHPEAMINYLKEQGLRE